MRDTAERSSARRRSLSLLLALSLLCSLICAVPAAAADAEVLQQTYAADQQILSSVERLAELDILRGDPDGGLYPERTLKRSEFAAMVNRAYGFTQTGSTPFTDVPSTAWYADDIGIAYNAGYFYGTSPTTASPLNSLTREQTLVMLARNMRMDEIPGQAVELSDGDQFSDWSRGYARAAAQAGIIDDEDGAGFRPKDAITRGEMAQLLVNCVGTPVRESGVQTLGDVAGNVTVSAPGAVIRDTTIAGDLYISGGIGSKGVTLENVNVLGRIVVAGGGEAEGGTDSVVLRNVEAENLLVDNISGNYLSLRAEGDTSIADALFKTDAFVLDRTGDGYGLLNLKLDADSGAAFTLSGNLKNVTNLTPNSTLTVAQATVNDLVIDEDAVGSTLNLSRDSTVRQLGLDTAVPVTGTGDIDSLQVNTLGSSTEALPDKVTIRPGLTAQVAGEEMDTQAALESSTDPRLLAGYPKVKSVAPTSATAVFSGNKAGTVYWAVSAVNDGSIGEEELIEPLSYGSKAVQQGSVKLTASNTEVTAAVKSLTKGGTYYLSAVMVDARGVHSPVKVVSFSTPDDTVPAFTTTPTIVRVGKDVGRVQISATTNKDCILYYALMGENTNLTPNDFKTGKVSGNLGYGTLPMTQNVTEYINVNSQPLGENKTYLLFLWLTDADGVKSSAVTKVTVKTGDETSPWFTADMSLLPPAATSLSGSAAINEAGTIYWVAVKAGAEFPKPMSGQTEKPALDSTFAKVSVSGAVKAGDIISVGKANTSGQTNTATVRITNLKAENAYDIYYVAQDKAGNYSEVVKVLLDQHTLDTNPPSVRMEFDPTLAANESPSPDTSIKIIFSENVRRASTDEVLLTLYEKAQTGNLEDVNNFADALRETIQLWDDTKRSVRANERTASNEADEDWVIDYRKAKVELYNDTGELVVTFPHNTALNLGSGYTYHFLVKDIADTSVNKNTVARDGVNLGKFTTIFAQVEVYDSGLYGTNINYNSQSIPADIGFQLEPYSTSKMASGQKWDMLIWSDHTISFDLYARTRVGSSPSSWTKVGGTQSVDENTGVSLTVDFNQANVFPDLATGLRENVVYEYAVNIKSIDLDDQRQTWSETVRLDVSVVTAKDNAAMSLISTDVDHDNFNATVGPGKSVTDITSVQYDEKVGLIAPFKDVEAPYLIGSYPRFETSVSGVKMTLMTNRTADVYWGIAPVTVVYEKNADGTDKLDADGNKIVASGTSSVGTVAVDSSKNVNNAVNFHEVPSSGSVAINSLRRPLFALSNPTYRVVKTGSFPKKGGPLVADGNIELPINVTGLEAGQWYYAYFLLEGSGQNRSEVYVYKFCTDDVARPVVVAKITGNTQASITAYQKCTVNYLLATHDGDTMGWLDSPFSSYAIPSFFTDSAVSSYQSLSVLDAIKQQLYNGTTPIGSVFDHYAQTGTMQKLLGFFGTAPVPAGETGGVRGLGTDSFTSGQTRSVDCLAKWGSERVQPGPRYVFFAMTETDAGYSFSCDYDIRQIDQAPPRIISATVNSSTADVVVDASGTKLYKNVSIVLQFSTGLYKETTQGTRVALHVPSSGSGIDSESAYSFVQMGSTFKEGTVVAHSPATTLVFDVIGTVSNGSSYSLTFIKPYCNSNGVYPSGRVDSGTTLTILFKETTGGLTADFKLADSNWDGTAGKIYS